MNRLVIHCACAAAIFLLLTAAHSEEDIFLRAVGFALTGSDDANPKVIDRTNCIFAIGKEVFHLNNIEVDRIEFQSWQQKSVYGERHWVTVGLHGDSTVYEDTTNPLIDDGSAIMRDMKRVSPDSFVAKHIKSNEHVLELATSDQPRAVRAWQYVYAHGCVGKKSPF